MNPPEINHDMITNMGDVVKLMSVEEEACIFSKTPKLLVFCVACP
jgi:hypothetical protein